MWLLWGWAACSPRPAADLVTVDPARSEIAGAGVLFTAFETGGDGFALLVDGDGRTRWSYQVAAPERVVRVKPDGAGGVWMGVQDAGHEEGVGRILHQSLDGVVRSETVAPTLHHDVVPLPDGQLAWLGHRFAEVEVPGHGVLPLATDQIRVGSPGAEAAVVFDYLDDYPVAPYWTCGHMALGEHIEGHNEWTHTNSLVPAPDGGWYLMPRYLDALVHLTPDFAVDWQLGGVGATVAAGEAPLFAHAHFSDAWADRVLVFDNGDPHGATPVARVRELAVDPVAGTAEAVWTYDAPDGAEVTFLGDAKRLPGGNTLIAWGSEGRLTEVTPDGAIVWQLEVDRPVGRAARWTGPLP